MHVTSSLRASEFCSASLQQSTRALAGTILGMEIGGALGARPRASAPLPPPSSSGGDVALEVSAKGAGAVVKDGELWSSRLAAFAQVAVRTLGSPIHLHGVPPRTPCTRRLQGLKLSIGIADERVGIGGI